MASCTVTSPLCTWLVAACMSMPCEKNESKSSSCCSLFQSKKRLNRWARRMGGRGGVDFPYKRLVSAFYGSGFQGLMSSCLAFEPCEEYYSSKGLSSSLALFGDNGFSLFGSKTTSSNGLLNRRQRRLNRAAHAGKTMAVAVQHAQGTPTKKPVTKQRRVVVTGTGVVTPLGHESDVFYNNLLEGVSGVTDIEAFDCSEFPTRIAGEIKSFSTDGWVAAKLSKRADKFMLYMLTAGKKALADGGIPKELMNELDKSRCGVLIGSAMGGMKVFNDAIEALRVSYRKMNPFCVPFATTNMGSAMLAMDLGWMGPNYSISTACATSNFCIINAANHIIRGEASRDGFVMGEGAGVLLLEELEHAKKRGAKIYAEFLGGSITSDAYHMTEPHPEGTGVVLCIEKALAQSGVSREDVNYINAHATSTQAGDIKEYQALIRCFGQNPELKVNSTKSMIGHLLGAAGAVEAVATVQAIRTGWVHPNVNLENPEEGVDLNVLVGPRKEKLDIKVALSNSFGFGGHNSCILFAPHK
ncbi:hypothetical protein Scep_025026 [Stephania cephalantha]|uniref:beta-ketoacyl-[acyl-carrier-protein] synthase I n=1 Tax=Stephania cephalantha TaxID=152367 RepID=A0AAP0HYS9_9MAGN